MGTLINRDPGFRRGGAPATPSALHQHTSFSQPCCRYVAGRPSCLCRAGRGKVRRNVAKQFLLRGCDHSHFLRLLPHILEGGAVHMGSQILGGDRHLHVESIPDTGLSCSHASRHATVAKSASNGCKRCLHWGVAYNTSAYPCLSADHNSVHLSAHVCNMEQGLANIWAGFLSGNCAMCREHILLHPSRHCLRTSAFPGLRGIRESESFCCYNTEHL